MDVPNQAERNNLSIFFDFRWLPLCAIFKKNFCQRPAAIISHSPRSTRKNFFLGNNGFFKEQDDPKFFTVMLSILILNRPISLIGLPRNPFPLSFSQFISNQGAHLLSRKEHSPKDRTHAIRPKSGIRCHTGHIKPRKDLPGIGQCIPFSRIRP